MTLSFPSPEFDAAVAGVCHGSATDAEMRALNELLRHNPNARDEYLLQVELHTRLASDPDVFSKVPEAAQSCRVPDSRSEARPKVVPLRDFAPLRRPRVAQVLALAACLVFVAWGVWSIMFRSSGATSNAVAMLTRTVNVEWGQSTEPPRVGGPLAPGVLHLKSGLAQVVFYSGARIVIEGPTELRLVSPMEAICPRGRLLLEVPPPARGFRLRTPQVNVVDLGTSFGVDAMAVQSEVHVFKGKVDLVPETAPKRALGEGQAAVFQGKNQPRLIAASTEAFASLFEFHQRSLASEAFRYEQWQFASAKLDQDPDLLVRLDFESPGSTEWTLRNTAVRNRSMQEAIIVGCARAEGRWREKLALDFQSVNDRVRLALPGDFNALTLSAWICVKGLDRKFNSLFMSDGFDPGTVHWLIRNDGVLGLTVFGDTPGKFQIMASPPVIPPGTIGMWQHVAVVVDGETGRLVHYLNGRAVSQHTLKLGPPFRVGSAELGNWNTRNPDTAPALIRNLSGSFDEFALFSRALTDAEIWDLHLKGKPDQ